MCQYCCCSWRCEPGRPHTTWDAVTATDLARPPWHELHQTHSGPASRREGVREFGQGMTLTLERARVARLAVVQWLQWESDEKQTCSCKKRCEWCLSRSWQPG